MPTKNLFRGAAVGLLQLLSLSLASASEAVAKHACAADSCLAAVKQGAKPLGPGDCKGFFRKTVIPHTTLVISHTKTVYMTTPSTRTVETSTLVDMTTSDVVQISTPLSMTTSTTMSVTEKLRARTADAITRSQTKLPPYASRACHNAQRFSSACSCIGATHKTITSTPSKTKTTTVTVTRGPKTPATTVTTTTGYAATTTVSGCPQPQPTFTYQVTGGPYDGYIVQVLLQPGATFNIYPATHGNATAFTRNYECNLQAAGTSLYTAAYSTEISNMFLDDAADIALEGLYPIACLPTTSGADECYVLGNNNDNIVYVGTMNPRDVYIANSPAFVQPGEQTIALKEIPVAV